MNVLKIKMRQNKSASVLSVAVVLIIVLSLIGLALLRLGFGARLQQIHTSAKIAARAAADAGLIQAKQLMYAKLAAEEHWDNSTLPETNDVSLPYSNSSFNFTITGDPCDGFIIRSTGVCQNMQKTVCSKLVVKSSWFGIGVKEGIDFKVGTTFGTVPKPNGPLIIRTNSVNGDAITFKAGVTIPGDVIVGPGGDPEEVINIKSTTDIQGQTYAADEEMVFPSVIVPSELNALPTSSYIAGTLITGDVKYSLLNISGTNNEVTGNTRIYVVGKMTLDNGAELIVKTGASLEIYLGGNLETKNSAGTGGIANENPDATKLTLYGLDSCTKMDIKAKGDFYGAIYAPNATLNIFNGGNLYGAYIGNKNLSIKNNGKFYFDTRLLDTWIDDPVAYLSTQRWWEE